MSEIHTVILASVARAVEECLAASDTAAMPAARAEAVIVAQAYADHRGRDIDVVSAMVSVSADHMLDAHVEAVLLSAHLVGCEWQIPVNEPAYKRVKVTGSQRQIAACHQLIELFRGQLYALHDRLDPTVLIPEPDGVTFTQLAQPNPVEFFNAIGKRWMIVTRHALSIPDVPPLLHTTQPVKDITSE